MTNANEEIQNKTQQIVTKSLKQFNYSTYKQDLSGRLYEFMKHVSNRPMSKAEVESAIEEFGMKNVITYLFNGDRGSYFDTLKAFNDEEYEKQLIRDGLHPLYVTEEEAKMYHSRDGIGTHSPIISSHFTRLGSSHGKESASSNGLIYDLFKSRVLIELTPEGLMEYVFNEYHRMLSKPLAVKIAFDINKQRKIFEGRMFTGEIGDDRMTKQALIQVNRHCKESNISFETSNELGQITRKLIHNIEQNMGREIGKMVVNDKGVDRPRMIAKIAVRLSEIMNTPVEDVGALLSRPMRMRKKN